MINPIYGISPYLVHKGATLNQKEYFVRPLGTTYGTGDGKTYATAWSGFATIDWTKILPGITLNVCGVHGELLAVGASGIIINPIIINFANINQSGQIDGNNAITTCFDTNDQNYITIKGDLLIKSFRRGTVNCTYTGGTSTGIVYNHVWATESGNQAFQNEGNSAITGPTVVYNFCKGSDSLDDGMSGHGTSNITCNYCEFSGNAQGVNAINTVVLVANNCQLLNNTAQDISADDGCNFTFNNCIIDGTQILARSTVALKINNCLIKSTDISCLAGSELLIEKTRFVGICGVTSYGLIKIGKTLLSPLTTFLTQTAGSVELNYNIHRIQTDNYIITHNSTGTVVANNCDFIGSANVGRCVNTSSDIQFNNCIYNDLKNGFVVNNAKTITDDFGNVYDVTTPTYVFSGTITRTNSVVGDPKLNDVVNNDFSLQVGSAAIGTGKVISGKETGIASANWGNGTTETPIVITKLQAFGAWDLGAVIH